MSKQQEQDQLALVEDVFGRERARLNGNVYAWRPSKEAKEAQERQTVAQIHAVATEFRRNNGWSAEESPPASAIASASSKTTSAQSARDVAPEKLTRAERIELATARYLKLDPTKPEAAAYLARWEEDRADVARRETARAHTQRLTQTKNAAAEPPHRFMTIGKRAALGAACPRHGVEPGASCDPTANSPRACRARIDAYKQAIAA
jgi:hypothetical protein